MCMLFWWVWYIHVDIVLKSHCVPLLEGSGKGDGEERVRGKEGVGKRGGREREWEMEGEVV